MANWRNMFKPWISARGREYFECGQVLELKEVGSVVTAAVSGSRAYRVDIHRTGEHVIRMRPAAKTANTWRRCCSHWMKNQHNPGWTGRLRWRKWERTSSGNCFTALQRKMEPCRTESCGWFPGRETIQPGDRMSWSRSFPTIPITMVGWIMIRPTIAWWR